MSWLKSLLNTTALLTCIKFFWKLNSKTPGFSSDMFSQGFIWNFPSFQLQVQSAPPMRSSWAPCSLAGGTRGLPMPKGFPQPVKTSREGWKRSMLMRHSCHTETECYRHRSREIEPKNNKSLNFLVQKGARVF